MENKVMPMAEEVVRNLISKAEKSQWMWGDVKEKNYLTPPSAIRLLQHAPWRVIRTLEHFWGRSELKEELEIFHRKMWWAVARTDLLDDVCTGAIELLNQKDMDPRIRVARRIAYGARLKRHPDGRRTFAIIDSVSDG